MTDQPTQAPPAVPTTDQPFAFDVLMASAYRGLFRNYGAFLAAAAIPLALSVLLQALLTRDLAAALQAAIRDGQVNTVFFMQTFQAQAQNYVFLEMLVGFVTSVVFAVAWHRFMLGHGRPPVLPAIGGRHVLFFLYSLLLALPIIAGVFLGAVLGGALAPRGGFVAVLPVIALGLLGCYLSLRMNLCLPAAAVGESAIGPGRSWEVMQGRVLTLFFASFLCVLPMAFGFYLFAAVTQSWLQTYLLAGEGFGLVLAMQVGQNLLALMIAALGIGVLSQALRSLVPDPTRVA